MKNATLKKIFGIFTLAILLQSCERKREFKDKKSLINYVNGNFGAASDLWIGTFYVGNDTRGAVFRHQIKGRSDQFLILDIKAWPDNPAQNYTNRECDWIDWRNIEIKLK